MRIIRFNALINDLDPKDKATILQLRERLRAAADEMDDHPGIPKYEAAFKAAQKQYDDFMDKVKSVERRNAKFPVGTTVGYGPFTWKVTKITDEGHYFLKQVGGSGQVAEHVRERELQIVRQNVKLRRK